MKELPKDAAGNLLPFEGAKWRYIPVKPGGPIGIDRWTEFEKLRVVTGFGMTFKDIYDVIGQVQNLAAGEGPFAEIRRDVILLLDSLRRSIVDLGHARFSKSFYLVTLFVNREGDEGKPWSVELAEEYIEDWLAGGVPETELFFFASATVSGFREVYKAEQERLEKEREMLSGITQLVTGG